MFVYLFVFLSRSTFSLGRKSCFLFVCYIDCFLFCLFLKLFFLFCLFVTLVVLLFKLVVFVLLVCYIGCFLFVYSYENEHF